LSRTSLDFEEAFENYEIPSQLESSQLAQWVRDGKEKKVMRKRAFGGAVMAAVVVILVIILLVH